MRWEYPTLLLLALAVPILLGMTVAWLDKKLNIKLAQFFIPDRLKELSRGVNLRKRYLKRILILLALSACFMALARPQFGFDEQESLQSGIDIILVVDVSKSMLAQDVKPNRLERTKLGITDFIQKVGNDRIGLIPFAGKAFLMVPLTRDMDALAESLEALDIDLIPRGGTNLDEALEQGKRSFDSHSASRKVLILLSDGDNLEGNAVAAAKGLSEAGIELYTIGVGTSSGEIIPVPTADGGTNFVQDESGKYVKTMLNESFLVDVARAGRGAYYPLGVQGDGLMAVYQQVAQKVPGKAMGGKQIIQTPREYFPLVILLAWILLAVEFMLVEFRKTV